METPQQLEAAREASEARMIAVFGKAMERAPWSVCRIVGSRFGLAFFAAGRRRREMATANVRRAFPQLGESAARQIARRSAQNFGMSFCEFLHLRTASREEIHSYCEVDGLENFTGPLSNGRGAILATAHFGAWEVMGARAAQEFPLTVVVRLTHNRALLGHIKQVRRAVDIRMLHKNDPARASLKVLHDNGVLGIFPDQYAGDDAMRMNFFGHPTRVITSPARLSLATRAPIVPAYAIRRTPWLRDGRVVARVLPAYLCEKKEDRESAVQDGTRRLLDNIEDIIREYPDQWLWAHRRWRE